MKGGQRSVTAVILAAGSARRFGADKLHAELAGRPLLAHAIGTARRATSLRRIVVIAGPRGRLPPGVDGAGIEVVACAKPDEGLATSLRCGIAAAEPDDGLVLLGDQPFVRAEAIDAVVDAGAGPEPAARAFYAGRPGHPVLLRRELFPRVRELQGDEGARRLLEAVDVAAVELPDPIGALDVDTPADLERAARALRVKNGLSPASQLSPAAESSTPGPRRTTR